MARKVKWTEAAWIDLEEAADYIARDSPHYAAAFVREVRDGARNLHAFWEREGRLSPEDRG
jgi:plasmid stabilization system protein ParE